MGKTSSVLVVIGLWGLGGLAEAVPPPRPLDEPPKGYVCYRTAGPITIDGRLDEPSWRNAPETDEFVDIEGDIRPHPRFRTRARMLWDDDSFYIAAEMEEPHVWGTLTERDSVIFYDNDFEVFIDPDGVNHEYYEIEINALNTVWDLFLPKPYKDGGQARNEWDIPGLKTAIHIDGTLNDPSDEDRGWSVEMAIPWSVLAEFANRPAPPHDGDQWRVNFSRVQWRHQIEDGQYRKVPDTREDNWVWSPQGIIDMHRPERWGYVQFSQVPVGEGEVAFRPDPAIPARDLLHEIYYAQRAFRDEHQRWAADLDELDIAIPDNDRFDGPPAIETDDEGYRASVTLRLPDGSTQRWRIRHDSKIEPVR